MITQIFFGLPSIPLLEMRYHPEGALFRVELDVVAIEIGEGFTQIVEQAIYFSGLDDDVVDVDFDVAAYLLLQAGLHAPLIGGSSILQANGNWHVAVHPMRGDEHGLILVFNLQSDLVVS
jgi:hypothetical protein